MPLPSMFIRASSATVVTTTATVAQRTNADTAYPSRMPLRFGAASISRRMNPLSKSRAIPKPVNTPANAADCKRTNTNWNAV